MNKIRRYYWQIGDNKYSLKLSFDPLRDRWQTREGKYTIHYTFKQNNAVLFTGNDFHPSPLYNAIGIKSARALMGFLTLKYGDTDKEYFDNYTSEQIAFSESMDCEELQSLIYDYENKRG